MNHNIYIVEDLDIIAESLKTLLETLGYNVVGHSFTGEDALERIPKLLPDLILMDINLGSGIDGIEVTHELNKSHNFPVVFLTATQDKNTIDRALRENPYAFIKKGMSYIELKQTVELALNKSEQVRLQQEESKELKSKIDIYNEVFESSPLGIFFFDLTFSILDANPASLSIFNKRGDKTPPDIDSILAEKYTKPIKKACQSINYDNPDPEIFNSKLELFILDEYRNSSPCELHLSPVFDSDKNLAYICAYIWNLSDVFEETKASRNLIEELLVSRKDIESQAADLVQMTATLEEAQQESAEIMRTNQRILSSVALDLEDSLTELTEAFARDKQNLLSQGFSANPLGLVKNLSIWSSLQTGRINPSLELIELKPVIDKAIDNYSSELNNKSIRVNHHSESVITAICDKQLLETIIGNILSNAIKYSENGKTIDISCEEYGDIRCKISITDNGTGTALEPIDSLLRYFVKYTCPGTNGEKGYGLGLIVCNELLQLCAGRLELLSSPGEGTNTNIILPTKN